MENTDLRAWMAAHRWSIAALSRELGIHPATLHRYRQGVQPIPKMLILALRSLEAAGMTATQNG